MQSKYKWTIRIIGISQTLLLSQKNRTKAMTSSATSETLMISRVVRKRSKTATSLVLDNLKSRQVIIRIRSLK